jgi:hypothetical protein
MKGDGERHRGGKDGVVAPWWEGHKLKGNLGEAAVRFTLIVRTLVGHGLVLTSTSHPRKKAPTCCRPCGWPQATPHLAE